MTRRWNLSSYCHLAEKWLLGKCDFLSRLLWKHLQKQTAFSVNVFAQPISIANPIPLRRNRKSVWRQILPFNWNLHWNKSSMSYCRLSRQPLKLSLFYVFFFLSACVSVTSFRHTDVCRQFYQWVCDCEFLLSNASWFSWVSPKPYKSSN